MRIGAGTLGSRRIATLKGETTRPTSDKVRAAIYNKIGPYFQGGTMLDVFAGSGGMSFEALSRGFTTSTMIEKSASARKVINKNIETLNLEDSCQLLAGDALEILSKLKDSYDLIYVDPPYAYSQLDEVLAILLKCELLKPDGWLIVESSKDTKIHSEFQRVAEKVYGITRISYYKKR